jgi:hypothetical protein
MKLVGACFLVSVASLVCCAHTVVTGDFNNSFLKNHMFSSSIKSWLKSKTGDQGLRDIKKEYDVLQPALDVFDTIVNSAEKARHKINVVRRYNSSAPKHVKSHLRKNIAYWESTALSIEEKEKAHAFVVELGKKVKEFNTILDFCCEQAHEKNPCAAHQKKLNKSFSDLKKWSEKGMRMFGYAYCIVQLRAREFAELQKRDNQKKLRYVVLGASGIIGFIVLFAVLCVQYDLMH